MDRIKPSEITSEHVYLSRRKLILGLGALTVSALLFDACKGLGTATPGGGSPQPPAPTPSPAPTPTPPTDELGDRATPYQDVTHYNNFYEFTMSKEDVAPLSQKFKTLPWTLTVGGLVNNPRTYAVEDL
ncbi:MAG: mononuclear molybdenum enzyme YedY, partial [Dehalococcoidia bacterium]|nr:mononuclear molybdenum enzyme YedY [Dehalococcoidia bacterium]